jgi:hypothetical protein
MSKQSRSNNGKQPNQYVNIPKLFSAYRVKSIPGYKESQEEKPASEPHQDITTTQNDKWSKADLIALGMLIVTGILAIYTYGLYNTAIKDSGTADASANAAKTSAQISQKTLDEIKDYNTKSLEKQQSALDKADATNKKNFDRVDEAIRLQDSALKQTANDFEIANAPYLSIEIQNMDIILENRPVTFDAVIKNLGAYPAKIIEAKFGAIVAKTQHPEKMIDTITNRYLEQTTANYVDKGTPLIFPVDNLVKNIDSQSFDRLYSNKKWFLYFFAIIKYQNLVTKKYRVYKCGIEFDAKKNNRSAYIINDNDDTK